MTESLSGLTWFESNVKPLLSDTFELKYIDEKDGDLGDLSGVQFDSEKIGGYIYFWSSGYVGYQLVDYLEEVELVEDTTEEVLSRSYDEILKPLISHL
ncbi:hypothetical protein [Alkalimarinus coralli]|uniref:hypothetical protein n=1 Tax=Alkalimarinus coralli TaxID=2935863 RepID=UPI00202ACBB6|nr:hypothetical protein [Alkalimarinus coralli]